MGPIRYKAEGPPAAFSLFLAIAVNMNDPYSRLLQALSALDTPDKYDSFKVSKASYKHLGGSSIHTDLLIPSRLLSTNAQSRCPVMVRVHGGFLVRAPSSTWWPTLRFLVLIEFLHRSRALVTTLLGLQTGH